MTTNNDRSITLNEWHFVAKIHKELQIKQYITFHSWGGRIKPLTGMFSDDAGVFYYIDDNYDAEWINRVLKDRLNVTIEVSIPPAILILRSDAA